MLICLLRALPATRGGAPGLFAFQNRLVKCHAQSARRLGRHNALSTMTTTRSADFLWANEAKTRWCGSNLLVPRVHYLCRAGLPANLQTGHDAARPVPSGSSVSASMASLQGFQTARMHAQFATHKARRKNRWHFAEAGSCGSMRPTSRGSSTLPPLAMAA